MVLTAPDKALSALEKVLEALPMALDQARSALKEDLPLFETAPRVGWRSGRHQGC